MKDILTKVDRNDGMTVPDGYFDDFAAKMMASLPEKEWESPASKVMPRSFWQKVRPYVYLAAMFMGVWCMMKMFDLMRSDSYGLQIENNPVMTPAIGNDHFINDYFINECDVNDYQLMEDLYETGFDPEETDMGMVVDVADSVSLPDSPEFPLSEI